MGGSVLACAAVLCSDDVLVHVIVARRVAVAFKPCCRLVLVTVCLLVLTPGGVLQVELQGATLTDIMRTP